MYIYIFHIYMLLIHTKIYIYKDLIYSLSIQKTCMLLYMAQYLRDNGKK